MPISINCDIIIHINPRTKIIFAGLSKNAKIDVALGLLIIFKKAKQQINNFMNEIIPIAITYIFVWIPLIKFDITPIIHIKKIA